jgi:hypothetical protein
MMQPPFFEFEHTPITIDRDGFVDKRTEVIASCKLFPGMVVSADSLEKAIEELTNSMKVQMIHDSKLK